MISQIDSYLFFLQKTFFYIFDLIHFRQHIRIIWYKKLSKYELDLIKNYTGCFKKEKYFYKKNFFHQIQI